MTTKDDTQEHMQGDNSDENEESSLLEELEAENERDPPSADLSTLENDDLEADSRRRRNEMNMFSDMANGFGNSSNSIDLNRSDEGDADKDDDDDDDKDDDDKDDGGLYVSDIDEKQNDENNCNAHIPIQRDGDVSSSSAMANGDHDYDSNEISHEMLVHEEVRRKNEMSLFSAAANGDYDSAAEEQSDDEISPEMLVQEEERRKNEMSMFSTAANGDYDSAGDDSDKEDTSPENLAQEEVRLKNEMSMFSAAANGDYDSAADDQSDDEISPEKLAQEEVRRKNEMNMFSAAANGDYDSAGDNNDKEEMSPEKLIQEDVRRKNEMNMFSALASGGWDASSNDNTITESKYDIPEANATGSMVYNSSQKKATKKQSDSGAGTFVSDSTKIVEVEENKNLNAALAMFESEIGEEKESEFSLQSNKAVLPPYPAFQATQRQPVQDQIYSEKVMVQRPLFFGTVIPERVQHVLTNGREQMYRGDYIDDDHHEHMLSTNRDGDFDDSSAIKNIESAVEVFGRFSFLRKEGNLHKEALQIKSHISLYEPVWGNDARLRREDRIQRYVNDSKAKDVNDEASLHYECVDPTLTQGSFELSSPDFIRDSSPEPRNDKKVIVGSPTEDEAAQHQSNLNENLFLQYARSNSHGIGGTFVGAKGTLVSVPETDTLRNTSNPNGSFEASELKKHIGLNDNLSRALVSLAVTNGESATGSSSASFGMVEGVTAAEAIGNMPTTAKGGRSLSNLEMTGGKVPLYGCDDEPLPTFIDLFIPETQEDQIRSYKQDESEEIISSQALPNIFGPLVCPSNCIGPDDNQSWFTRRRGRNFTDSEFLTDDIKVHTHRSNKSLDSLPDSKPGNSKFTIPSPLRPPPINAPLSRKSNHTQEHKKTTSDISQVIDHGAQNITEHPGPVGWWNVDEQKSSKTKDECSESTGQGEDSELQMPPIRDKLRSTDYGSLLSPSRDDLLRQNKSLSELHPAVDTIAQLPLLSDRHPSTRYVQVDTTVVGFPSLGEVEPFFCSMAIWHVDPGTTLNEKQMCGRVTESLCFDIVSDSDVEESCRAALCPNTSSSLAGDEEKEPIPQTTRCGIFPVPSYYEMRHLHAVIIVKKVLAETSDLEVYWNSESDRSELAKHRMRAGKAAERSGAILTPFAFGVAPLGQVLGSESPIAPTSKAAQIPLFKLAPGEGDRSIVNHIMAMVRPRCRLDDRSSQAADVTNGGTAMLVMRNFGNLGIHSVVSGTSKLARDRLVDFTGEIQVRMKSDGDVWNLPDNDNGLINVAKNWHSDFISEPTVNGGRICSNLMNPSSLYAQEVASVPLFIAQPNSRLPKHLKLRPRFHTNICNEIFMYPLSIESCNKRNVTVKLEIARLMMRDDLRCLVAIPVPDCIHNSRRGPYLVPEAFTSCAYHKIDPQFMDELKVKLPLSNLNSPEHGTLVAIFTAYHVTVKGKKKWPLKSIGQNDDSSPMEQIACGFLSLSEGEKNSRCLIEDSVYSIRLKYRARPLSEHKHAEQSNLPGGTIVLEELVGESAGGLSPENDKDGKLWDFDEFLQNNASNFHPSPKKLSKDAISAQSSISSLPEKTESITSESLVTRGKKHKDQKSKQMTNLNMSLNVRTVAISSIHPQNEPIAQFFDIMPKIPRRLDRDEFCGVWKMSAGEIKSELEDIQSSYEPNSMGNDAHLTQSTIEISKSNGCPHGHLTAHFLRISFQLWRTLVAGDGTPTIAFANPASTLPLRVHTFSTMLYLLNSVSSYLAKSEVKETNGAHKWSIGTMARLVSMLFDEEALFIDTNDQPLEKCCDLLNDVSSTGSNDEKTITSVEIEEVTSIIEDRPSKDSVSTSNCGTQDCITTTKKPNTFTDFVGQSPTLAFQEFNFLPLSNSSLEDSTTGIEFSDSGQVSPPTLSPTSSQDDILLKGAAQRPAALRTRSFSAPNKHELKVDTKSDFQFALSAGASPSSGGNVSPFGGTNLAGPAASRRKWLTGSLSLATISEDNDKIDNSDKTPPKIERSCEKNELDDIDTEIILNGVKTSKVKQMRVPKVQKHVHSVPVDIDQEKVEIVEEVNSTGNDSDSQSSMTVPKMDEIETAGTAFLDSLDKDYGNADSRKLGGEERRVGVAHHRKTKSRLCSIDWSLPPPDHVIESHQQMEILNRGSTTFSPVKDDDVVTSQLRGKSRSKTSISKSEENNPAAKAKADKHESDIVPLPTFLERLASQAEEEVQGRWFPYAYEVIIFQWRALLGEQRKKKGTTEDRVSPAISQSLAEAAQKSRGLSISCAPILFAIIRQSLGFRIDVLFRRQQEQTRENIFCPPLVSLDKSILSALEWLIRMATDACMDSRNFDSWSFRNTSISVSESIARFLRDLFAYLDPNDVHRLILVYFSRFVSKEGKQWKDKHSKIGLRCSWEVSKLRLTAVTTFVRMLDFVKINKPLMDTWGDWSLRPPTRTNRHLFSDAIEELQSLGMSSFAGIDPARKEMVIIPEWKPHWLVELVTDICLSATGHLEQNIQNRAAALLYELFWTSSVYGKVQGSSTVVASLYLPLIPKLLGHVTYISSLHPKSQLRKDLLPCFVFVLQGAPFGLLRALWRKLCKSMEGKGASENYGGIKNVSRGDASDTVGDGKKIDHSDTSKGSPDSDPHAPCILDICSLLNLSLSTFEYEGSESNINASAPDLLTQWHSEYLSAPENERRKQPRKATQKKPNESYTSTSSRKWNSHDAATVIISTCRNIVREYVSMLQLSTKQKSTIKTNGPIASFSVSPVSSSRKRKKLPIKDSIMEAIRFSYEDKVVFLRAVSSVYLNCLSLRQSDIVLIKTLIASTEIVKVFGIELFLTALGETLQHWMRVILFHCGARRAKVRVEALDFLALILRLQWDSFGSFTRVRIPLLATMTEVMQRLVATAAARYYRKQKQQDINIQYLSNVKAEASLTPLWRTLTRLHDGSASNNAAFKSALQLLANKMKTLYKSYIAAHALAIVNRNNENPSPRECSADESTFETTRVVMESAEFSKKILGYSQFSAEGKQMVTHNEVVEDAFLAAANVFATTELPLHRVAWLRKLAEFHSSRGRNAEEAACRLQMHNTLKQAAALYESLWNSKPFWPWASDGSDGFHFNDDDMVGFDDELLNMERTLEGAELDTSMQEDTNQSFRRIFYRVANSVRMRTGDWDVGGKKTLFYGVTFASEYISVASWIALREIETEMVEEAENAGQLFLKAGIVESSRYCWGLATQFYSNMFNYARLAYCYRQLANVVASQVPSIDTSNQLELSSSIGRFYRVYFHGGAAHELMGKEFVYRAPVKVKLEEFCRNIKQVLRSILHEKTDIELVLDDGRVQETGKKKNTRRQFGAVPRESMTIKVTPLKPLLSMDKCPRGSAEWFYQQTELAHVTVPMTSLRATNRNFQNDHTKNFRPFSSMASNMNSFGRPTARSESFRSVSQKSSSPIGGEEIGVCKFSFTQLRDRLRGSRDLLKASSGDVSEKSLRVTELLVSESMPNCVSRQPVSVENRSVFNQSPLEAGVEAVCSWCAVLFRTAVATNGLAVIGDRADQGIGTAALRVISECIHRSRVKEIGLSMLVIKTPENGSQLLSLYEKLTEKEVTLNRVKLARAIVIFMELLHVLIGRNRDILLNVNESRKRHDASSTGSIPGRGGLQFGVPPSPGLSFFNEGYSRHFDDVNSTMDGSASRTSTMDRTDKAMAIQRELQLSFIKITKALRPVILSAIRSKTPKWMKLCCQDNYFSTGAYKQTRIAIGEELLFFGHPSDANSCHDSHHAPLEEIAASLEVPTSVLKPKDFEHDSYAGSEGTGSRSVASSSRESRSANCTI